MAKCPCCHRQLPDQTFYIRWFDHRPGKRRLWHGVFTDHVLFTRLQGQLDAVIDGQTIRNGVIVGLQSGIVYRNNSDKALPEWIKEPMLRASIACGAMLPPIYKKDKKKVDRKAVTA
jgi:hypothetical protein